jgi:chemotaxis protein MotB
MAVSARRSRRIIDIWPGYVDALAALLILVIFVLLLFTFAQFLLSQLLESQETELDVMYQRVVELTDLLGLEQTRIQELEQRAQRLDNRVLTLSGENQALSARVETLTTQTEADQAQIAQQLLSIASYQEDIDALRQLRDRLEAEVGILAGALERNVDDLGAARDRSKALAAQLADQQERTLLAQQTIAENDIRIQALSALVTEREAALAQERQLSADARAELLLVNQQLDHLQTQLDEISRALAAAEAANQAKDAEIEDLGQRLNVALAREVNRLEQYRSDFFGRLREVLGENAAVRIVGDRFLLPSELLFDSGSAVLGTPGQQELTKLATTLKALAARIPPDLDWILRVDGHTDRVPINTASFPSNWELSTARAVSVVRFLISQGIPAGRLSAAGFGEFHPIDPADTPEAYQKNRRIELKLTSR